MRQQKEKPSMVLTVRMPLERYKKLCNLANAEYRPVSNLANFIIKEYLRKQKAK